jgi:hypothetical protein
VILNDAMISKILLTVSEVVEEKSFFFQKYLYFIWSRIMRSRAKVVVSVIEIVEVKSDCISGAENYLYLM